MAPRWVCVPPCEGVRSCPSILTQGKVSCRCCSCPPFVQGTLHTLEVSPHNMETCVKRLKMAWKVMFEPHQGVKKINPVLGATFVRRKMSQPPRPPCPRRPIERPRLNNANAQPSDIHPPKQTNTLEKPNRGLDMTWSGIRTPAGDESAIIITKSKALWQNSLGLCK